MQPRKKFRDVPLPRPRCLFSHRVQHKFPVPDSHCICLRSGLRLCVIAVVCVSVTAIERASAQTGDVPREGLRTDRIDLPTPINQPPDANANMQARQHRDVLRNFDRANALRIQQIEDETAKLLILSRDLKTQIDMGGDKPLSPILIRETEVIRILAHDVQAKMTLTVRAD